MRTRNRSFVVSIEGFGRRQFLAAYPGMLAGRGRLSVGPVKLCFERFFQELRSSVSAQSFRTTQCADTLKMREHEPVLVLLIG